MFSVHFSVLIMGWLRAESLWAPIRKLSSRARTSAARTSPDFVMSEWAPFCERSPDFWHSLHIPAYFFMWENCSAPAGFKSHCCRLTSSGGFRWLWLKKSVNKLKDVRLGAKLDLARLRLPCSWDEQSFCKEKQTEGENLPYLWDILGISWSHIGILVETSRVSAKKSKLEVRSKQIGTGKEQLLQPLKFWWCYWYVSHVFLWHIDLACSQYWGIFTEACRLCRFWLLRDS